MKWLSDLVDRIIEKEVVSNLLAENAALKAEVEKLTSINNANEQQKTDSQKFPTLAEVQEACVRDDFTDDDVTIGRDYRMVKRAYDYICQQLGQSAELRLIVKKP